MSETKLTEDDLDDLAIDCEDAPEVKVRSTALLSLIAAARELEELKGALELLDRGDGNRGTHGSDMRAPALLDLARRLGWTPLPKGPTK